MHAWIALVAGNRIEIVHLKPGMEPETEFTYSTGEDETLFTGENDEIVPNCEGQPCNFVIGEKTAEDVLIYAYCSLHGLWKAES